jgi:hypothetical protein
VRLIHFSTECVPRIGVRLPDSCVLVYIRRRSIVVQEAENNILFDFAVAGGHRRLCEQTMNLENHIHGGQNHMQSAWHSGIRVRGHLCLKSEYALSNGMQQ